MVITRENIERAENLLIDLCAGGLEERQELLRLIADALLGVEIYSGEKKVLGHVEIEPLAIEGAEPAKQTKRSDLPIVYWETSKILCQEARFFSSFSFKESASNSACIFLNSSSLLLSSR